MSTATIKISDIANEIGCPSREIIEKANEIGIKVKYHSTQVTLEEAKKIYEYHQSGIKPQVKESAISKAISSQNNIKTTSIKNTTTNGKKYGNDINVVTINKQAFIEEEIKIHRATIKEIENKISTFDSRMDVLEKSGDKRGLETIKIELVKMIGGMQYAQMTIDRLQETK